MALEEYSRENTFAAACGKKTFATRMEEAGLAELATPKGGPRRKCQLLSQAGLERSQLVAERGQRLMLASIADSLPAYCSGIRCWAAYCDAMGHKTHFPATAQMVIGWASIFSNPSTYTQYVKHLRWAHGFLHLPCTWETRAVKQVERGLQRSANLPRVKRAVTSKQVHPMITEAVQSDDLQVAALMAVARLFLLRVPSEGLPLQWSGEHSQITLTETVAKIQLAKRKNSRGPVLLTRKCCCATSGRRLCAVHWLHIMKKDATDDGKVFQVTKNEFGRKIKLYAQRAGVPEASRVGTHAFRRGMAQDIIDQGGSLAALMTAGGWTSSAYAAYLRDAQLDDAAVTRTIICLSDSD